jgi:hypothetical protein
MACSSMASSSSSSWFQRLDLSGALLEGARSQAAVVAATLGNPISERGEFKSSRAQPPPSSLSRHLTANGLNEFVVLCLSCRLSGRPVAFVFASECVCASSSQKDDGHHEWPSRSCNGPLAIPFARPLPSLAARSPAGRLQINSLRPLNGALYDTSEPIGWPGLSRASPLCLALPARLGSVLAAASRAQMAHKRTCTHTS